MLAAQVLELMPTSIRIIRGLASQCLDGSITMNHVRVLGAVDKGYSQAEVASIMSISEAAVSKTVAALVDKKLLKKKAGEDKRSWDVTLTREGARILGSVRKQMEDKFNKAIEKMSKSEQADLAKGMKALENLMLSLKDEACNGCTQKEVKTKRNK